MNEGIRNICIAPFDEEMEIAAKACFIVNNFRRLGFTSRKSFVQIVMDLNENYRGYKDVELLNRFWVLRVRDIKVNVDLENVLDKLKAE